MFRLGAAWVCAPTVASSSGTSSARSSADDAYASEILGVGDALHTMTVGGHKDGCPLTTIAEMRVLSLDPQLTRYEDEDGWQVGYPVEAVWVRVEYPTRRA